MTKNMELKVFLRFITNCSGDEAIDIITKFQCGALSIEHISVDDVDGDE